MGAWWAAHREACGRLGRIAAFAAVALYATSLLVKLEWFLANIDVLDRGRDTQRSSVERLAGIVGFGVQYGALLTLLSVATLASWMRKAHLRAAKIGAHDRLRYTAREASLAFWIPVVNLYRPIDVVRSFVAAAEPSDMPPITVEKDSPGYRQPPREAVASPIPRTTVPVRAWWLTWVAAAMTVPLVVVAARNLELEVALRLVELGVLLAAAAAVNSAVLANDIDCILAARERRWAAMQEAAKEQEEIAEEERERVPGQDRDERRRRARLRRRAASGEPS